MKKTHRESVDEVDDNAALIRGRIIGSTIQVEQIIEYIILRYFTPKHQDAFAEAILYKLSWEEKIKILEHIAKTQSIDVKNLVKRIRIIKHKRNQVAHWMQLYLHDGDELIIDKVEFYQVFKKKLPISITEINGFKKECRDLYNELLDLQHSFVKHEVARNKKPIIK